MNSQFHIASTIFYLSVILLHPEKLLDDIWVLFCLVRVCVCVFVCVSVTYFGVVCCVVCFYVDHYEGMGHDVGAIILNSLSV